MSTHNFCKKCNKTLVTTGDTADHCIKCDYEINNGKSRISDFFTNIFEGMCSVFFWTDLDID